MYGIPSFKLEKDVVQAEIDIIKEICKIRTGVVGKDILWNNFVYRDTHSISRLDVRADVCQNSERQPRDVLQLLIFLKKSMQ